MSDPDVELVKAIRSSRRGIAHEYLCNACAHRDHAECEGPCSYCSVACQCVCGRWALPVGKEVFPVEKE